MRDERIFDPVNQAARIINIETLVLPSQFIAINHTAAEISPEHKLMVAVLEDALRTWQRRHLKAGTRSFRQQQEAHVWLFADNLPVRLTLHDVCEALQLDVSWLRSRLRAWRHQQTGDSTIRWRRVRSATVGARVLAIPRPKSRRRLK